MELTKNNSSHSQLSYKLERNIVKLLTLTSTRIINVYLLFVSFCRFFENFGLN